MKKLITFATILFFALTSLSFAARQQTTSNYDTDQTTTDQSDQGMDNTKHKKKHHMYSDKKGHKGHHQCHCHCPHSKHHHHKDMVEGNG